MEVGAGADGLHTGVEGEGDDSAIGQATKGHNSLQMRLRLDTAEGEEGEEEEMDKREAQLKPMDAEELAAYLGEEEATIAEAAGSVTGEGHGTLGAATGGDGRRGKGARQAGEGPRREGGRTG